MLFPQIYSALATLPAPTEYGTELRLVFAYKGEFVPFPPPRTVEPEHLAFITQQMIDERHEQIVRHAADDDLSNDDMEELRAAGIYYDFDMSFPADWPEKINVDEAWLIGESRAVCFKFPKPFSFGAGEYFNVEPGVVVWDLGEGTHGKKDDGHG